MLHMKNEYDRKLKKNIGKYQEILSNILETLNGQLEEQSSKYEQVVNLKNTSDKSFENKMKVN